MIETAKFFSKWTRQDLEQYLHRLDRKAKIKLFVNLLVGLISIPFIIWPAWVLLPQNQALISDLHGKMASAQTQIALEPKLFEEEKGHVAFIQETDSRLFTEIEVQRLLGVLTEVGQKSGVSLLSSQPQSETQKIPAPFDQKYRAVSYLLTVEGGYHALASFVSEIENYPKILHVDEFSVTPQEEMPTVHIGEIRFSAFLIQE